MNLIELIMVILIIALLVGITVPSVLGMRRKATESDARAAVKDIGSAVVQMMDDRSGERAPDPATVTIAPTGVPSQTVMPTGTLTPSPTCTLTPTVTSSPTRTLLPAWTASSPPDTPRPVVTDADGDGYPATTDCNDTTPFINPGMAELPDGIDNNCNGLIDEGLVVDKDGDTFPEGLDCKDDNPDIHPLAIETPDDGIDSNCDGRDNP